MQWSHVQGTGNYPGSPAQTSVSVAFTGPVTAGNLIVASLGFYSTQSGAVTLADTVNGVNYTYEGPSIISGTQYIGTWYYQTPKSAPAGAFGFNFSNSQCHYPTIVIDEFSFGPGCAYVVDSQGYIAASGISLISLSSPLSVSGPNDLIYAAGLNNGGVISPGTGFTLGWSNVAVTGTCYGIGSEWQYPVASNINPTMGDSTANLYGLNAVAFRPICPVPSALLPGM